MCCVRERRKNYKYDGGKRSEFKEKDYCTLEKKRRIRKDSKNKGGQYIKSVLWRK